MSAITMNNAQPVIPSPVICPLGQDSCSLSLREF